MRDAALSLLGLARKAGRLEAGDEPVSVAARSHRARLILMACDAGENILRKGAALSTGNCPALTVPFSKAQMGNAVGRSDCALLAFTDVGLASALANALARADLERYGEAAAQLNRKAAKILRRREKRADRKRRETAGRKP